MNISTINISTNGLERSFIYRNDSEGDVGVIRQIFAELGYGRLEKWDQGKSFLNYYNKYALEKNFLIVDAGANIGASSVYFAMHYPDSTIFAIEPDFNNWHILSLNTNSLNCINFHGAISNKVGELCLVDPGRSDWGFMTDEPNNKNVENIVKAIDIPYILNYNENQYDPLILKIDIEGGEDRLFKSDNDWLDKFPLVIIELHDWMLPFKSNSKNFLKAITKFDFEFVHYGENLFFFNRKLLVN